MLNKQDYKVRGVGHSAGEGRLFLLLLHDTFNEMNTNQMILADCEVTFQGKDVLPCGTFVEFLTRPQNFMVTLTHDDEKYNKVVKAEFYKC